MALYERRKTMKRVVFICMMGMSTSMLVKKVDAEAKKRGSDLNISAMSEAEAMRDIKNYDVILLGPQIKYVLPQVQKALGDRQAVAAVIDSKDYGFMDGAAVLDQIECILAGQ
jgi:cellobiose PTS system EIIB component